MNRPILITGAMSVETGILIEQTGPCRMTEIGMWHFYEGSLDGWPTVIAETLVGHANAAAATALAIEKYDPACIIAQGTSGAHHEDLHPRDIVIGKTVAELGLRITAPREEGEGTGYRDWRFPGTEIREDGKKLMRFSLPSDDSLVKLAENVPYAGGKTVTGIIASGDMWNREADVVHFLRQNFQTECEEMESFAIFQTAKAFGVPALAIRIISNNELIPGEEYDRTIGIDCQRYVLDVAGAIIENYRK